MSFFQNQCSFGVKMTGAQSKLKGTDTHTEKLKFGGELCSDGDPPASQKLSMYYTTE